MYKVILVHLVISVEVWIVKLFVFRDPVLDPPWLTILK